MDFLIGAATSNSGKTTITIGLLRALQKRGLKVQPYKCGPDYIDTKFHAMACGTESVNLDLFMSSTQHVRDCYRNYGESADIRIVEGVMGLFDGHEGWKGSSAELASVLELPVVLVVNAQSVAYSVAPLIYGFRTFCPPPTEDVKSPKPIRLAGVIFNKVASDNHFQFLKRACEDAGTPCLGYMPRNPALIIPDRHLGLSTDNQAEIESLIDLAAKEAETHIDIEQLLN